jgi:hypothetical protein
MNIRLDGKRALVTGVLLDRLSPEPYHKVLTGLEPRISGECLASKDRNVEL